MAETTASLDGYARTLFSVEGMRCAGCARSIERAVAAVPGVEKVHINVATGRVSVDWRSTEVHLAQILNAVSSAGFKPVPLTGEVAEQQHRAERHLALKRIGLAGLGSMQVMMYVFGLYITDPSDIDPAIASFLRYVGMLITTPILFYSGAPFFVGAWRSIRQRTLGMDVPVAFAVALAYSASVYNTLRGTGQTYFDSVTMFIFFLSVGRFVEMMVRRRSLSTSEALVRSLPTTAVRVKADQTTERIPIRDIVAGDCLSIPRGAMIPVDATLMRGVAFIDESLVTGESTPVRRNAGDRLLGGGVNTGDAIQIIGERTVEGSTLASIVSLLERAQSGRPRLTLAADRAASWFVGSVLVISAFVAGAWMLIDATHAFSAALAVLVVTCPCALSLATPVATAAATTRLARLGVLVTRPDTLERLARVDTVVLDKTGTLTTGEIGVQNITLLGDLREKEALAIGAALERASDHPIARAFAPFGDASAVASETREIAGSGIEGCINGETWRLGHYAFVAELSHFTLPAQHSDGIYLGTSRGLVAAFEIRQEIRPEASAAIQSVRALGLTPVMASGDREQTVQQTARALGIERAVGRLNPEEKLTLVLSLQSEGKRVLMIGDGVNDGPVLALADVSCAMGQGSAVAHAAADMLLLHESLDAIAQSIQTSRRMLRVIRQNLTGSLIYNFSAIPLAAFDILPPWLAALGMSLSSLIVVLNARRLASARRIAPKPYDPSAACLPEEALA